LDVRRRKWQETGEGYIIRTLTYYKLHQILFGDQAKEDDMDGTRSTHSEEL